VSFAVQAAAVFVLLTVLDFAWARYTLAIQGGRVMQASLTAGALYALSGLATLSYVADWRLLPFAVAGAAFGTFIALRWTGR
jgi:hypothetical protein